MRVLLLKIALLFALLSGQWAYAYHQIDAAQDEIAHAAECITCLTQHADDDALSNQGIPFVVGYTGHPTGYVQAQVLATRFQQFNIRAPPL